MLKATQNLKCISGNQSGFSALPADFDRAKSAYTTRNIDLARALLGAPPILLLDEADANLDDESEDIIQRVLQAYKGTILMISHRCPQLSKMDQVWHLGANETRATKQIPTPRLANGIESALAAVN